MPELPEVAVLASDIRRIAASNSVRAVRFQTKHACFKKVMSATSVAIIRRFIGSHLKAGSNGKHLILSGEAGAVRIHLGMTGHFKLGPITRKDRAHHFFTIRIGADTLHYLDFRRFSRIQEYAINEFSIGGYKSGRGLSLTNKARLNFIVRNLPGLKSAPRISWLLRHGRVTGIGNYLANEALGRLNLNPYKHFQNEAEAMRTLLKCQALARASYRVGGTSFGIGYYRIDGSQGTFAEQLKYYRNPRIKRREFSNRGVYSLFPIESR